MNKHGQVPTEFHSCALKFEFAFEFDVSCPMKYFCFDFYLPLKCKKYSTLGLYKDRKHAGFGLRAIGC